LTKCHLWYKLHYAKKKAELMIETQGKICQVVVTPFWGPTLAACVAATGDIQKREIERMLLNGPICGSEIVEQKDLEKHLKMIQG